MNLLPDMTHRQFVEAVAACLQSEEFDARGEMTGYPLFERSEDRRKSGTDLQGVVPLLVLLLNRMWRGRYTVSREQKYPRSNERCDLVVRHPSGKELWCELKLSWEKPCTPYDTAFTRDEYLTDIDKLAELSGGIGKANILIAFRNSDRPGLFPVSDIDSILGSATRVEESFSMPTKQHGDCYCHVIMWNWE